MELPKAEASYNLPKQKALIFLLFFFLLVGKESNSIICDSTYKMFTSHTL